MVGAWYSMSRVVAWWAACWAARWEDAAPGDLLVIEPPQQRGAHLVRVRVRVRVRVVIEPPQQRCAHHIGSRQDGQQLVEPLILRRVGSGRRRGRRRREREPPAPTPSSASGRLGTAAAVVVVAGAAARGWGTAGVKLGLGLRLRLRLRVRVIDDEDGDLLKDEVHASVDLPHEGACELPPVDAPTQVDEPEEQAVRPGLRRRLGVQLVLTEGVTDRGRREAVLID
eukprot:scaffold7389_cov48-Phaeocystis_antarctica.AAC.5